MTGGAIEQPESELVLQFADHDAEPGRRNEERLGRAPEVAMLRHQEKGAQLPSGEIDHQPLLNR